MILRGHIFSAFLIQIVTMPLRAQIFFFSLLVGIPEILLASRKATLLLIHTAILLLQTYNATVFVTQMLAVLLLDPIASISCKDNENGPLLPSCLCANYTDSTDVMRTQWQGLRGYKF